MASFFCERPLIEQDGVMSAIRIFDKIFVPKLEQDEPPQSIVPLTLLLMFKGGGYKGPAKVRVVPKRPSGMVRPEFEQDIQLPEQQNGGANVIANVAFAPAEEGVYWFDVFVNDELITRIPLEVQLLPSPTPMPQPAKVEPSPDQQKDKN